MKAAQAREREARLADSREKRDLVMSKIREAYFQAKEAASSAEFAEAGALLSEALAWMKNGWEGFNTVAQLLTLRPGVMTWEDREECWAEWKEARELLRVEENDDLIQTLQAEVDECEELERSARTENFAARVRDRIEAKAQRSPPSKEETKSLN
jgi:hypothetical protein